MSFKSSASSSGDESAEPNHNPNPKLPEDQFASLALSETDTHSNGVAHGSTGDTNHQEIENNGEEVQTNSVAPSLAKLVESSEVLPHASVGGVEWGRTTSELEVDGPSSPSSSGYAGERGSSSASSGGGSGIDEISEVRNNEVVDGLPESQASWVPGKRDADEVLAV